MTTRSRILSRFFAVIVALGAAGSAIPPTAHAQDPYIRLLREVDRPTVFHEAVVLPGADVAQVFIAFRIPNDLLVFVQQEGAFTATPEVSVRVYRAEEPAARPAGERGVVAGAEVEDRIWRGAHTAGSFEATQDGRIDLEGHVSFDLPQGRYTYELSLSDDVAGRVGTADRTPFVVPNFSLSRLGAPFFGRLDGEASRLELTNLGGDAPFGASAELLVPASDVASEVSYRLFRLRRDAGRFEAGRQRSDVEEADLETDPGHELVMEGSAGAAVPLGHVRTDCLCWSGAGYGRLYPIDLRTNELENGVYLIEVRRGEADTSRHLFLTLWREMPLSLYDAEVAIRNLEFIETRDQIRELMKGSPEDRIRKFEAYWADRDPTPGTPSNELMAEYYHRVDAAAQRFQTGRTPYPDGLRTDAARVYVVHGPPADVTSSFPSGGGVVQEWTYPDGRRFVFHAATSLDALELREEGASPSAE